MTVVVLVAHQTAVVVCRVRWDLSVSLVQRATGEPSERTATGAERGRRATLD